MQLAARLWDRLTENIDGTLMLTAVLILALGLFTLYSALTLREWPVRR